MFCTFPRMADYLTSHRHCLCNLSFQDYLYTLHIPVNINKHVTLFNVTNLFQTTCGTLFFSKETLKYYHIIFKNSLDVSCVFFHKTVEIARKKCYFSITIILHNLLTKLKIKLKTKFYDLLAKFKIKLNIKFYEIND